MKSTASRKLLSIVATIAAFSATSAFSAPNFSDYPLSTTGQAGVQPNIMFTLDDSGSMSWDYLPDWSTLYLDPVTTPITTIRYDKPVAQQDLFRNPQYNGLAYNPAVRYLPPYYLNTDGTDNTTTYPSMTGTSAATGADTAFALPNWRAVKADAYGIQTLAPAGYPSGTGVDNTCPDGTYNRTTCNLQAINTSVTPNVPYAFSYQFRAGEYCTDTRQTDCALQFGPTSSRPVASVLRWCTTLTNQTDCQALFDDTGTLPGGNKYIYPRVAGKATGNTYKALVTVSTCSACSVSSVSINGTAYPLPALTDAAGVTTVTGIASTSALASKLYDVLPKAIPGLGVSGLSGSTFYVYLPLASAPTWSITASGATFTTSSWTTAATNPVGSNSPTYISSTTTQYTKSGARTDCAAATYCTYAEEMTNYANWLAYYRTRLQMMKTAASNAFKVIDDHYRVGYFTISKSSFINPDSFISAKKKAWYDNLFTTDAPLANATPLRGAISRIGQFYAGTHNSEVWGTSPHQQTVVDPMQYYCQQNFDILATDGYWNTSDESSTYGPRDVTNAVNVNQQDGGPGSSAGTTPWTTDRGQELRPQYDGEHPVATQTVSQTVETDTQWTRTDAWSEKNTAGYQQKIWDLYYTVNTWGLVQTTTSYTKVSTPYTYTQVTTPYTWTRVDTPYTYTIATTPYTWTKVTTPYTYTIATTPYTWTKVTTPYTYTTATTPYTYTKVTTPYTYTTATTPYTWTKVSTPYTWTQVVYTGVASYAYVIDGTPYSGKTYCPLSPTSLCTVTYPTYTSVTTTGQTTCTASGSVGSSTYTTCTLVAGTPTTQTGQSSCTTQPTPTGYGTKVTCTLVAGTTTTQTGQSSCTVAAVPSAPGNAVTCTPVAGTATTQTGQSSCSAVAAPTSAGGTANSSVSCTLVAGTTTTQTGQGSCTVAAVPSTPGNAVTCTPVAGSATTLTGQGTCSTVAAPTSAGGTANSSVSCTLVAGTTTTQTGQGSCTVAAVPSTPGNAVTCTPVAGSATTLTGQATCSAVAAPTSAGGTANTAVSCTLVAGTTTTQTGQNSCTAAGVPTTPGNQVVCTPVAGTSTTYTGQSTCTVVNPPTTGGGTANTATSCTLVAGTSSTVNGLSSCTVAATPTAPGNKVTCTPVAGSATTTTEGSCTTVNAPTTSGGTAVTAVACTQLSIPDVNITSGTCPSSTASQTITCSALQKISSLQLTNQTLCKNGAGVTGTVTGTGTTVGQVTCSATYTLRNSSPYWVASATTPSTSSTGSTYSSTPTYGTGSGKSTLATVYGTSAYASSTAAVGPASCTASGVGVIPVVTCTPVSNVTHPSSCSGGSYSVSSYTNGSGATVTAGTGTTTCSNATLQTNQPANAATCTSPNGVPTYNASTGKTTTCTTTQTVTAGLDPSACTASPANNGNGWISTTCTPGLAGGSTNSLADVTEYYYRTDLRPSGSGRCTGAIVNSSTNDVCITDLTSHEDTRQFMSTYTLGLGVSGQMLYSPTYPSDISGDYYEIKEGNASTNTKCRWNIVNGVAGAACNWPIPVSGTITTIDDLWHAAVDGRGKYFSAGDPTSVSASLSGALSGIAVKVGAGSAAATSNLQPIQGDNYAYVASFETQTWVGDLQAREINLTSGAVSTGLDSNGISNCGIANSGCLWSAQVVLDAQNGSLGGKNTSSSAPSGIATSSTRSIYLEPYPGSTTLRPFNYTAISAHSDEAAYFTNGISGEIDLSWLVTGASPIATVATNLIDYLAGSRAMEGNGFRVRAHIMGDIVDSAPIYVGKPAFAYGDSGYTTFYNTNYSRAGVVYSLANDGMLHAFDSATGKENWAFVPRGVLPQMYQLAKASYSHINYLDGKITVGDAYFQAPSESSASWHTVLVAGFGKGSSGYFALDVTDPTAPPKFLWSVNSGVSGFENLGYSYGNAVITKLPDGRWVTLFSSGYNNADGHGYLYAVNIADGTMMNGFPLATTDSGTAADPSNLGQISTWVDIPNKDNSTYFVYAGDFMGNVWRFDLGTSSTTTATVTPCTGVGSIHNCTTGLEVFKLAQLTAPDGSFQPITTHIETTTFNGMYRLVFVATGSYLTTTDAAVTQTQSAYAIKDTLEDSSTTTQSTYQSPRDLTTGGSTPGPLFMPRYLVADTLADGSAIRVTCATSNCASAANTVDWSTQGGWYVDYPEAGERSNIDMVLALGTLIVPTNVPASSACESGGHAWINYVDYSSGLSIVSNIKGENTGIGMSSQLIASALAVGVSIVQLPDNSVQGIVTTSDYKSPNIPLAFAPAPFMNKLDSWRDLETY